MFKPDKHALILLSLDDRDTDYSFKCLRIAEWHLSEAGKFRRTAEIQMGEAA